MKHIILTIIILLTMLFSAWCSAQARPVGDSLCDYYLRNWLCIVPVTACVADPNDPNQIVTTVVRVRLNLRTWLAGTSPEIEAVAQGRPYGIGWSDDRKWIGNAVEVVE